ncbi:MAG: hypothetical protein HOM62_10565 [Rhodospirillaceae bacterium]|jgi:hypothetical protein|nr:hypothetical protein [Rhodospirillaceae bacterium]
MGGIGKGLDHVLRAFVRSASEISRFLTPGNGLAIVVNSDLMKAVEWLGRGVVEYQSVLGHGFMARLGWPLFEFIEQIEVGDDADVIFHHTVVGWHENSGDHGLNLRFFDMICRPKRQKRPYCGDPFAGVIT